MIFGVRKWPLLPTLIVVAAAAVMVMLGLWQLDRRAEEQAKLDRYAASADNPDPVAFPSTTAADLASTHYRRSQVDCLSIANWRGTAGSNAGGETGYVQIAACRTAGGQVVPVQVGWSRDLNPPAWRGGAVAGIIAPNRDGTVLLVADPPIAGMQANALPTPSGDQPGKNLAYAGQWFFFALTALVIYVLALRRRGR